MKKALYIVAGIAILLFDIVIAFSYFALDEPMHYRNYYKYTDLNGEKGTSPTCYTIEDGRNFCRNAKKAYPVVKYEKVKERK